jgi:hypothetical protein
MLQFAAPWQGTMHRPGGALKCEACGAVWKSPMAHQIALRDGRCLRCGGGPLIEVEDDFESQPRDDPPSDDD